MKATLLKARERGVCKTGYKEMLRLQGKTQADDEPVDILFVLDHFGLDDALWTLRVVEGHDGEIKAFFNKCLGLLPPSVPEDIKRLLISQCTTHQDINGESYTAAPRDSIYHVAQGIVTTIAANSGCKKGTPAWDESVATTRGLIEAELRAMLTK